MTEPLDLDAIEAHASAATVGPWFVDGAVMWAGSREDLAAQRAAHVAHAADPQNTARPDPGAGPTFLFTIEEASQANAEFIAHARADVPALAAEVRRLQAIERGVRDMADDYAYDEDDPSGEDPAYTGAEVATDLRGLLGGGELSDSAKAAEVGTCALCGQQLIRTPDDCWHPYDVERACPLQPPKGDMTAWQAWHAAGNRTGRPGREHFIPLDLDAIEARASTEGRWDEEDAITWCNDVHTLVAEVRRLRAALQPDNTREDGSMLDTPPVVSNPDVTVTNECCASGSCEVCRR